MITEMRRYAIEPGRMDEMHDRMREVLFPIFTETGASQPFAIWENRDDTSTLTWLVEWPSLDVRQEAYTRIGPAFAAVRLDGGGREFVTRTNLTLIAPWPSLSLAFLQRADACDSVWHVQPKVGSAAAFAADYDADIGARLRNLGALSSVGCNLLFGALPKVAVFTTWPDVATRLAGLSALLQQGMKPTLANALLGEGNRLGDRGAWETLDRADYLPCWTVA
jgi:hypothetical protein